MCVLQWTCNELWGCIRMYLMSCVGVCASCSPAGCTAMSLPANRPAGHATPITPVCGTQHPIHGQFKPAGHLVGIHRCFILIFRQLHGLPGVQAYSFAWCVAQPLHRPSPGLPQADSALMSSQVPCCSHGCCNQIARHPWQHSPIT